MAAKFRKVDPRIWTDERFVRLDKDGKLLALWVLTSTRINRCGILIWSPGLAADETGIARDCIDTVFDTVWHTMNWVYDSVSKALFMPRFFKHNTPPNPKALKGMLSDLDDVPTFDVKPLLLEALVYIPDKLKKLYVEQLRYRIDKIFAQEKEQEKEKITNPEPATPIHTPALPPAPTHTGAAEQPALAQPAIADKDSAKPQNAPGDVKREISPQEAPTAGEGGEKPWQAILAQCNADLDTFMKPDLPDLGYSTYQAGLVRKQFFKEFEIVWQNHPVHDNRPFAERVWRWLVRTPAIRDCVMRGHARWLESGAWDSRFVQNLDKWLMMLNFREEPHTKTKSETKPVAKTKSRAELLAEDDESYRQAKRQIDGISPTGDEMRRRDGEMLAKRLAATQAGDVEKNGTGH